MRCFKDISLKDFATSVGEAMRTGGYEDRRVHLYRIGDEGYDVGLIDSSGNSVCVAEVRETEAQ